MGKGSNQVTTSPPEGILSRYYAAIDRANQVSQAKYTPYKGQLVAPLSPLEQQAQSQIGAASQTYQPYMQQAQQYAQQATRPITATPWSAEAVQQYENPYQQDVVKATMSQLGNLNAEQLNQVAGNAASSGAWGGDRAAVAQSEMARQQGLAAGQTLAGLNAANYQQAQQQFNTQQQLGVGTQEATAQNLANAAYTYGNLGVAAQNAALAGIGAEAQMGAQGRGVQQAQDVAKYQQWLNQKAYPFQAAQYAANILEGIGGQAGGITTYPTPSTFSQIGGDILGLTGLGLQGGMAGPGGLLTRYFTGGGGQTNTQYHRGGPVTRHNGGGIDRAHYQGGGDVSPYAGPLGVTSDVSLPPRTIGGSPYMSAPGGTVSSGALTPSQGFYANRPDLMSRWDYITQATTGATGFNPTKQMGGMMLSGGQMSPGFAEFSRGLAQSTRTPTAPSAATTPTYQTSSNAETAAKQLIAAIPGVSATEKRITKRMFADPDIINAEDQAAAATGGGIRRGFADGGDTGDGSVDNSGAADVSRVYNMPGAVDPGPAGLPAASANLPGPNWQTIGRGLAALGGTWASTPGPTFAALGAGIKDASTAIGEQIKAEQDAQRLFVESRQAIEVVPTEYGYYIVNKINGTYRYVPYGNQSTTKKDAANAGLTPDTTDAGGGGSSPQADGGAVTTGGFPQKGSAFLTGPGGRPEKYGGRVMRAEGGPAAGPDFSEAGDKEGGGDTAGSSVASPWGGTPGPGGTIMLNDQGERGLYRQVGKQMVRVGDLPNISPDPNPDPNVVMPPGGFPPAPGKTRGAVVAPPSPPSPAPESPPPEAPAPPPMPPPRPQPPQAQPTLPPPQPNITADKLFPNINSKSDATLDDFVQSINKAKQSNPYFWRAPKGGVVVQQQVGQADKVLEDLGESDQMARKTDQFIADAILSARKLNDTSDPNNRAGSWYHTGPGDEWRHGLVSALNTIQDIAGVAPENRLGDPDKISAGDELIKDTRNIAQVAQNALYGKQREAAYVVSLGIGSNPSVYNTPQAIMRLLSLNHEANNYIHDRYMYAKVWAGQNGGSLYGFDNWMNRVRPPMFYTGRALIATVPIRALQYLRNIADDPTMKPEVKADYFKRFDRDFSSPGFSLSNFALHGPGAYSFPSPSYGPGPQ